MHSWLLENQIQIILNTHQAFLTTEVETFWPKYKAKQQDTPLKSRIWYFSSLDLGLLAILVTMKTWADELEPALLVSMSRTLWFITSAYFYQFPQMPVMQICIQRACPSFFFVSVPAWHGTRQISLVNSPAAFSSLPAMCDVFSGAAHYFFQRFIITPLLN